MSRQILPDAAILRGLYEAGLSQTEIGERYGVSDVAVHFAMKKHGIPARRGRPIAEDASYTAIHEWLTRHHSKTGVCEECGAEPPPRRHIWRGKVVERPGTDWAFLRHPAPHTRDRADYRELCDPCHRAFDAPASARSSLSI